MSIREGFFFKTSKTRKKRKKKKKKPFKRKKKERKWSATNYPYRDVTKGEAIKDFLTLRKLVQGNLNPKSIAGNGLIDWGTEKARRKTRYRNKSFIEKWNNKTRRKKMLEFAKRLKSQDPRKSVLASTRAAIDLQWGTVNTLRAAAAALLTEALVVSSNLFSLMSIMLCSCTAEAWNSELLVIAMAETPKIIAQDFILLIKYV